MSRNSDSLKATAGKMGLMTVLGAGIGTAIGAAVGNVAAGVAVGHRRAYEQSLHLRAFRFSGVQRRPDRPVECDRHGDNRCRAVTARSGCR